MSGNYSPQSNMLSPLAHAESIGVIAVDSNALINVLETLVENYDADSSLDDVAAEMRRSFRLPAVAIARIEDDRVHYNGLSAPESPDSSGVVRGDSVFQHLESEVDVMVAVGAAIERRILGLEDRSDLWAYLLPVITSEHGTVAIASFGTHDQLGDTDLRQKLSIVGIDCRRTTAGSISGRFGALSS